MTAGQGVNGKTFSRNSEVYLPKMRSTSGRIMLAQLVFTVSYTWMCNSYGLPGSWSLTRPAFSLFVIFRPDTDMYLICADSASDSIVQLDCLFVRSLRVMNVPGAGDYAGLNSGN